MRFILFICVGMRAWDEGYVCAAHIFIFFTPFLSLLLSKPVLLVITLVEKAAGSLWRVLLSAFNQMTEWVRSCFSNIGLSPGWNILYHEKYLTPFNFLLSVWIFTVTEYNEESKSEASGVLVVYSCHLEQVCNMCFYKDWWWSS